MSCSWEKNLPRTIEKEVKKKNIFEFITDSDNKFQIVFSLDSNQNKFGTITEAAVDSTSYSITTRHLIPKRKPFTTMLLKWTHGQVFLMFLLTDLWCQNNVTVLVIHHSPMNLIIVVGLPNIWWPFYGFIFIHTFRICNFSDPNNHFDCIFVFVLLL